jgi:LuxR family maltose regulon positive regulatory protein
MPKPLLATKFYIPIPRQEIVPRPRLVEMLNHGLSGKLTLISAPAGFGKTTLLRECVHQCGRNATWLSLDEGDNEPKRFLSYLIAALQRVAPKIGGGVQISLGATSPTDIESILTQLVNDLGAISEPVILVLDDYHAIIEPAIQEIMVFILENQPSQIHLVIASRADPPWPLARFRARSELNEIRAQDMRFTQDEAAQFLNDVMGLGLSAKDIAALEARTEGWIAGLQMAALSMRGRADISGFIQSFTGSHRYVIDYLMEEVLEGQPPEIQAFLLKTSILERLTGDLCDAVVNDHPSNSGAKSQALLETLEQNNLFLIPLDDQRRWYRYHHLFADLLRNHLHRTYPDKVVYLHQRASVWYGMNDLLPDAIKHALAVDDIEQIAYLTEASAIDALDLNETSALMAWLAHLSDVDFRQYPWLLITRASINFKAGKYDQMEQDFEAVEKILGTQANDEAASIRIRGHMAATRSYLAELREDPHTAIQQAEAALAMLPKNEIKLRSFVSIRRANGLMWIGNLEKAITAYKEIGETSKQVGDGQSAIIALSEMAVVQMIAGKLREATESIQDICSYAEALTLRDGRRPLATGVMYRHLSNIQREQNHLAEASFYAQESLEICQQWGEKEALIFGMLGLARVKFAQREYAQVEELFQKILPIAREISPMEVKQFQSWAIHYQLLRGKSDEAEAWARELELRPDDVFGYEQRYEYQNLAHLLAAQGKYDQAQNVLDALVRMAKKAGDSFYLLQYLTLKAIVLQKINKPDEAMIEMGKALSIASPEGYVHAILDEGDEVESLLHKAIAQGIEVAYAQKLLAAIRDAAKSKPSQIITETALLESLSPRELEVLRLLVTDLSAPEIADQLVVSASTVRSHIKNIYGKLDAHSRHEAVTKARELGFL